jgi:hypothetical protein
LYLSAQESFPKPAGKTPMFITAMHVRRLMNNTFPSINADIQPQKQLSEQCTFIASISPENHSKLNDFASLDHDY